MSRVARSHVDGPEHASIRTVSGRARLLPRIFPHCRRKRATTPGVLTSRSCSWNLLKLSRNRSEEQQRHVRENLSEEELVVFEILTRACSDLNSDERNEVKKVARQLLDRLKQLLALDWQPPKRFARPCSPGHRRRLGRRPGARLSSGLVSTKGGRGVRARLRELRRQRLKLVQRNRLKSPTDGHQVQEQFARRGS